MKKILLIILVLSLAVTSQAGIDQWMGFDIASGGAECDGLLVCQNAEGTGYDNSESWSETGTVDEGNTSNALRGTQDVAVDGSSTESYTVCPSFAASNTVWVHFRLRYDANPASNTTVLLIGDADDWDGRVYMDTSGDLYLYHGGVTGSAVTLNTATAYHVWIMYTATDSGAATDMELYLSTDTTRS